MSLGERLDLFPRVFACLWALGIRLGLFPPVFACLWALGVRLGFLLFSWCLWVRGVRLGLQGRLVGGVGWGGGEGERQLKTNSFHTKVMSTICHFLALPPSSTYFTGKVGDGVGFRAGIDRGGRYVFFVPPKNIFAPGMCVFSFVF